MGVGAFAPSQVKKGSSTAIYGAFGKVNKQAALQKKMEAAKRQRNGEDISQEATEATGKLSDEEMKKKNDIKRFQQLLDAEGGNINYDIDGGNYKTKLQEEEEIDAGFRGVNRLFEGDPAPSEPFEDLIDFTTGNALRKKGASRVVPWLNKSSAKQDDYLIVVTDPREKSSELRSALKNMSKLLTADVLARLVVINADGAGENRKFLKNNQIENINMYGDEKREWMRAYTVLGEKRWAMCMMILKNGKVERIVREMDVELATKAIANSVKSLSM